MIYKNNIVIGKIARIDYENGLYVQLLSGETGFVPISHIGDINSPEWENYFSRFSRYKFKILSDVKTEEYDMLLSYKLSNPHVIKNKMRIIPTSKHFSTLKTAVFKDLGITETYDKNDNQGSNNRANK